MKTPLAVFGLGNPLMSDDGIGIHVLQALEARTDLPDGVELIDLGTGGLRIVHEAEGRQKLIFVDCAFMQEKPGTLRRFTPEEVKTLRPRMRHSLHEGDLLHHLEMARTLGVCPDEVVILGIEPQSVEPGQTLTPALQDTLDGYVEQVLSEIRRSTNTEKGDPHA
jgi:hydrogenase maturation protease